jgi:hypothetical protein
VKKNKKKIKKNAEDLDGRQPLRKGKAEDLEERQPLRRKEKKKCRGPVTKRYL